MMGFTAISVAGVLLFFSAWMAMIFWEMVVPELRGPTTGYPRHDCVVAGAGPAGYGRRQDRGRQGCLRRSWDEAVIGEAERLCLAQVVDIWRRLRT
jgi:hypothetical protein